ncbi:MAG TPA: preprotein translocase subunit SecE [Methylococcales bacterium]|jgi:preprotein translocase subunit SecE|nr:preprotein translocase subunit SecE [Methylococcaceae bacterium]HIN68532.1 preprotein translocase subunit SecE [Methylococcales bacterium]
MSTQTEAATSVMDVVKLVFSVSLVIAGLAGFYYFSEFPLLYRVLGLVAVVLVAMLMALTSTTGRNFSAFVREARQEVRKVVWPSRQETVQTTLTVFAMVFVVGLILWLFDMFLFWGVQVLTGQGG